MPEAWTIVSAVAAVTQRVEIGTLALGTSFRNPGLMPSLRPANLVARPSNGIATASMVLGILGIVLVVVPVIGLILAILAMVFGVWGSARQTLAAGTRAGHRRACARGRRGDPDPPHHRRGRERRQPRDPADIVAQPAGQVTRSTRVTASPALPALICPLLRRWRAGWGGPSGVGASWTLGGFDISCTSWASRRRRVCPVRGSPLTR